MTREGLSRAAERLAEAGRVVVSTGAGMSKESGIPTFRDAREGLWARFDPQDLATEAAFRAAPARVWAWYAQRRTKMAECQPHAGHAALVRLATLVPTLTIVTQNIDSLHQRAGSVDVLELHGSIGRSRCIDCRRIASGTESSPASGTDTDADEIEPPRCSACGSYLRPDVVWFGEMLPEPESRQAWEAVRACDVLLVVGTSGVVWPAAELPHVARRAGATVIEVNPVPSEVTTVADIYLAGAAGEVLPRLVETVAEIRTVG